MSCKASIIVLTYNGISYTRQCLRSVLKKTAGDGYEIIVVDNGSSDGTLEYLQKLKKQYDNVCIILNDRNEGFARANNQGATAAQGEYLVFLNNDTIVTRGWLDGLFCHLEDPTIGMVGPVTNSASNEAGIAVDYRDPAGVDAFAEAYTRSHAGQAFEISMLALFCAAMRRETFERVGPLDERFGIGMFEDDDYALRLRQAGLKLLCAEDVFVHHYGGGSFSKLDLQSYWTLFRANLGKFEAKWKIAWQPHHARIELLPGQIRQNIDTAMWMSDLIAERDQKLTAIQKSETWQQFERFRRFRLAIAPSGSRREDALRGCISVLSWPARAFRPKGGLADGRVSARKMSWRAFVYESYLRRRRSVFPQDLAQLRCPSQSGLVSIVLPVYNGAAFLEEALDSIFQQTYTHFELIAVDDGSTDDTPEILREYAAGEPRMRVIRQENQRLPQALTCGFAEAHGEFLTWISADNRLKPFFLERMVGCLGRHPGWDMVYANEDIIDERGDPLRNSDWFLDYQTPRGSEHIHLPANPAELNVIANNYIGAAFVYRDRVKELVGGYSPWLYGLEDYDYWMRVNDLLNLRHVDFDEPVYEYRFHPTSLTSRDEELQITRRRQGLMVFEDFRRDYLLAPAGWMLYVHQGEQAGGIGREIEERISGADGILLKDSLILGEEDISAWLPVISLTIAGDLGDLRNPPEPAVPHALRAFVYTGAGELPAQVEPGWDVRAALRNELKSEGISGDRGGWFTVPDSASLLQVLEMRAKTSRLAQIEEQVNDPTPPELQATVVICTYHRSEKLSESVISVARQTFPQDAYEVIVVNNDPADRAVKQAIDELRAGYFKDRPDKLRLIQCPQKGLSFARNAGLAAARGEAVCFIDDDAAACPDWLQKIWEIFERETNAGVVGGKISLEVPLQSRQAVKPGWEKFWSQFIPEENRAYSTDEWWKFPWGANWCARREALLKIGGFRTRYGRKAADFGGGEEVAAAGLIQKLGYSIWVAPEAEVIHKPDPARFNFRHVFNTIQAGQRILYNLQLEHYLPAGLSIQERAKNVLRHLKAAFLGKKLALHQRLELILTVWGEIKMLWRYYSDWRKRHRPSVYLR
ncbi:MAG: glycosyltransferase [Chloroflexi bacterium]|nr:glycosyltransferase [Chloroflexota bacterium]